MSVSAAISVAAPITARRRVLFAITSSDFGGTESALRELVLRLDPGEFEIAVCSLRPRGRIADELADHGVAVLSLDMDERPQTRELIDGIRRMTALMNELDVDLVHSFLYRANVLSRLSAQLAHRRPIVVSSQRSLHPTGDRLSKLASRWTQRLSDRVIAVSEAVRREVIRAEGLPAEQVVVIGNGVDVERYGKALPLMARSELRLQPGSILVGGVGRLSPEKGFPDLLEAVALARSAGVPVELLLAGSGPAEDRLRQRSRELALDVRFLGARRDAQRIYPLLDIFALPSLQEGAPNALLEAMAAARPIAATAVGGVPEMIEHEHSGLLVPPRQPHALAAALARLAGDAALRQRLGSEASRRAREHFDITGVVEQHAALYRSLLVGR